MIRPHARKIAAEILTKIEKDQAYSNILLNNLAHDKHINPEEFPIIQKMVRGVLENKNSIDAILRPRLSQKGDRTPDFVRSLLRIAIYQLQYLDRVSSSFIVNESVEVTKTSKYSKLSGLVNAVLRTILRESEAKLENGEQIQKESSQTPEEISAMNHPQWMVTRWIKEFGESEALKICQANNTTWPIYIRVNTERTTLVTLQQGLLQEGVQSEPAKYAKDTLVVLKLPKKVRLHELKPYLSGLFFIQDQSSVLVTELVAPKPGERILDLCSGPGGKTCSLALQMKNEGTIVAVEINPHRLEIVKENCTRLGLSNVEYKVGDGRNFHSDDLFDAVLLDVPCSGLGVIGRRADARWGKSEQEIEQLVVLQHELIKHGATLVRPGGRLIYSTCSIEIAENEEVVAAFLLSNEAFSKGMIPGSLDRECVTKDGYLRTWPHRHQMGGAFGAVLVT